MKELKQIIGLVLMVLVWCFPIIISFVTWNFWFIMLYAVWWMPAILFTALILSIIE